MIRKLIAGAALVLLAACSGPEAGIVGPLQGVDRVVVTQDLGTDNWSARNTVQITDPRKVAAMVEFLTRHDSGWSRGPDPARGDARVALYAGNSLRAEVVVGSMYLYAGDESRQRARFVEPTAMQRVRALWQG